MSIGIQSLMNMCNKITPTSSWTDTAQSKTERSHGNLNIQLRVIKWKEPGKKERMYIQAGGLQVANRHGCTARPPGMKTMAPSPVTTRFLVLSNNDRSWKDRSSFTGT